MSFSEHPANLLKEVFHTFTDHEWKKTFDKKKFETHIQTVHNGENPFKSQICKKRNLLGH